MKGINYGCDVGNLHVIDYYLRLLAHAMAQEPQPPPLPRPRPALRFSREDWSRYDGDLL